MGTPVTNNHLDDYYGLWLMARRRKVCWEVWSYHFKAGMEGPIEDKIAKL